jgi:hypothetical protein
MTQAIMVSSNSDLIKNYSTWDKNFITKKLNNIYFATMTKFYKEYD